MHIQHLNGCELLQQGARGKSRRQDAETCAQTHVQAISQERHKNVRLDPMFQLVKNRPQTQIVFEIFERRFHLGQLNIKLPQFGGVLALQIAAQ